MTAGWGGVRSHRSGSCQRPGEPPAPGRESSPRTCSSSVRLSRETSSRTSRTCWSTASLWGRRWGRSSTSSSRGWCWWSRATSHPDTGPARTCPPSSLQPRCSDDWRARREVRGVREEEGRVKTTFLTAGMMTSRVRRAALFDDHMELWVRNLSRSGLVERAVNIAVPGDSEDLLPSSLPSLAVLQGVAQRCGMSGEVLARAAPSYQGWSDSTASIIFTSYLRSHRRYIS